MNARSPSIVHRTLHPPLFPSTVLESKVDQKVDKELAILKAAVQVFATSGYHRSSISSIAKKANIATGTIYLYFERKEDLLTSLFQRFLGGYLDECEPILESAKPGLDKLKALLKLHLHFFERDPELAKVFEIHLREVQPILSEGIRPTLGRYFELIERILQEGVDVGELARDLDVRLARRLFYGGLDAVITSWVNSDRSYNLSTLLEPYFQMISRAFGAPTSENSEANRSGN